MSEQSVLASASAMIVFEDVSKSYELFSRRVYHALFAIGFRSLARKRGGVGVRNVLNGVSLSIARDEKVGIIGENGSGKTTLLKLTTGQIGPSAGRVTCAGNVQALMSAGGATPDALTGRQCIRHALVLNGLSRNSERRAYEDVIEFVELDAFLDHPVSTYSLGMRARLEFAIATAIEPDVLVIDEVLGAGDGYFAEKCAARMRALTNRSTLLLVSHSMQQIVSFCNRVIWIKDGSIASDGAPATVCAAYEAYMMQKDADIRQRLDDDQKRTEYNPTPTALTTDSLGDTMEQVATSSRATLFELTNGKEPPVRITAAHFAEHASNIIAVETGQPLSVEVELSCAASFDGPAQVVLFGFSDTGNLVWDSRSSPLDLRPGHNTVQLSTRKHIIGIGDYVLSVGLRSPNDLEHGLLSVQHACLFLRVLTTNYSDPPLFHCRGEWRFGDARDQRRAEARISAWV